MTIHLHLRKIDDALLLDSQDIYEFIDESSEKNVKFTLYLSKLCDYLNHSVTGNSDMRFGDTDYAYLGGWLSGYETAMGYEIINTSETCTVKTKEYFVILDKPKKVKPWFELYPSCLHFTQKNVQPDPIGHDDNSYCFCKKRNTEIIPFIHCKNCQELQSSIY